VDELVYRVVSGHVVADPTAPRSPALALLPDGLALVVDGVDPLGLPWEAFRGPFDDTRAGEECWRVEAWARNRHGDIGIAVQIVGPLVARALPVDEATGTWLRRMNRRSNRRATRPPGPGSSGYVHLPIVTVGLGIGVRARRDQLRALSAYLRDDTAARARLADERRAEALAMALDRCRLASPGWEPSWPDHRALWELADRAGLRWPYQRPLPGQQAPDPVAAQLAIDRARAGHPTEIKERVVKRFLDDLLDVEPWPFEALLPNFVDLP
jgi:hypothetical protein